MLSRTRKNHSSIFLISLLVFLFALPEVSIAEIFYSQSSGPFDAQARWNALRGGGGTSPIAGDFTNGLNDFVIQSGDIITSPAGASITIRNLTVESGGTFQADVTGRMHAFEGLVSIEAGGNFTSTAGTHDYRNGINNAGNFNTFNSGSSTSHFFTTRIQNIIASQDIFMQGATTFNNNVIFNESVNQVEIGLGSTVTIGSGITVTNRISNGFLNIRADNLQGPGTLLNDINAHLKLWPTTIAGNIDATATGNTVEYFQNGSQDILNIGYHNLLLNSSGGTSTTKSFIGTPYTIAGDLDLTSVDVQGGSSTINLSGNLTGSGTSSVISAFPHLVMQGSSAQTINIPGFSTFEVGQLTINNAAGVSIQSDLEVTANSITLTSGNLTVDGATLIKPVNTQFAGGTFGPSKMVVIANGGFVRTLSPTSGVGITYLLGTGTVYTPITINATFTSGATPYVEASVAAVEEPNVYLSGVSLIKHWSVNSNGLSNINGSIAMTYVDPEIAGDESLYIPAYYDGSGWTTGFVGDVTEGSNLVTYNITGASTLNGNYMAGEPGAFDLYTVTNTNDSGVGSLRWTIDNANASTGETISFNISGVGPMTISLISVLPAINKPVAINGKSQPSWDFASENMVGIDLGGVTDGNGFQIQSSNVDIKGIKITNAGFGIIINGEAYDNCLIEDNIINQNITTAININNGDFITIQGNHIGVAGDGLSNQATSGAAIAAAGSSNLVIGGDRSAGDGNVLAGNAFSSYLINVTSSTTATIQGNVIGASLDGNDITTSRGVTFNNVNGITIGGTENNFRNYIAGIDSNEALSISNADGVNVINNYFGVGIMDAHTIGNNVKGIALSNVINFAIDRNVISGSGQEGMSVTGTTKAGSIINNLIGVAPDGTTDFGNTTFGINIGAVSATVTNLTIGGSGNENILAYNNIGIRTALTSFGSIDVNRNSIFCNTTDGIDISGTPVVSPPSITSVSSGSISGTSTAATSSIVDIYTVDASCGDNQGAVYVGQATVTAGSWSLSGSFDNSKFYVATVTDVTNGISEFSTSETQQAFVTTWSTTDGEITIPTKSFETYNYDISWTNLTNPGTMEGTANVTIDTDYTITPVESGSTYRVEITGTFPAIQFNNNPTDRVKILTVQQWGDISWTSFSNAFYGCSNLSITAVDAPDLSGVTDMSSAFQSATSFNESIEHWDVSGVENFSGMFWGANTFNQPLDGWTVTAALDMSNMFRDADAFNQDLNSWVPSLVTTMKSMFYSANAFNGAIGNWDVSSVLDMQTMFFLAGEFNQPLAGWGITTGSVANMSSMFRGAVKFDQPINAWDVSSVITMASMFDNAAMFNQDLNSWVTTSLQNLSITFKDAVLFNGQIDNWDVSSVTSFQQMFEGALLFNQSLNNWTVTGALNMWRMFFNADAFTQDLDMWQPTSVTDMSGMFANTALFNGNITTWDVTSVLDFGAMFQNALVFNQPIGNWASTGTTENVNDMSYMFSNAVAFDQPLNAWNVSGVTNMTNLFSGTTLFNQDISSWDVSSVTSMQSMFNGADAFNQDLSAWGSRLGAVNINMANMFLSASAFNQSLGAWDISLVTNMGGMLSFSNLSTANYDATLIGWATLDAVAGETAIPANLTLSAAGLNYCVSETERTFLDVTQNWTISDAGVDCTAAFIVTNTNDAGEGSLR